MGGTHTLSSDQASFSVNETLDFTINDVVDSDGMTDSWYVQLRHPVRLVGDREYTICFDARAAAAHDIELNIDGDDALSYVSLIGGGIPLELGTDWQTFSEQVTATQTAVGRVTFNLSSAAVDVQFDNVGIYEGNSCGDPANIDSASGSGSANIQGIQPITTDGNQILFGGQEGSIAGMSLFWSSHQQDGGKFYTSGVVDTLKQDWNARLVRAAMGVEEGNGYLSDPAGNLTRVHTVVEAAIANDMYVIIDWHTHRAEEYQEQAIAFFTEMAQTYSGVNNVIYEIYNEPTCPGVSNPDNCGWPDRTTWEDIKAYSEAVIAAIREIDPDNLIIVGTPFYSQGVDEAAADPISDEFGNIAYALHFYAGTHGGDLYGRALRALDAGIPLFVTEWGTVDASGDGAVDRGQSDNWMSFLRNNNISHANWSISDKAEGASILRPGTSGQHGGWSDGDLTETGRYVRDVIRNW